MTGGRGLWLWAAILPLAAFAFLAAYLDRTGPAAGAWQRPRVKVTIASVRDMTAASVIVARQEGFFGERGLEVDLRFYPDGARCLEAVIAGKADIAAVGETPIVLASLRGGKFHILATVGSTARDAVIIGRKDRGIREPADLAGKRVGILPGTSAQFLFDSLLALNGIEAGSVRRIGMTPGEMLDAIAGGTVDVVAANNPHALRIRKRLGDKAVALYGEPFYAQQCNIVARPEFVRDDPAVAGEVISVLVATEGFVGEHPGESQRLVAEFEGLPPDLIAEMWEGYDYRVRLQQALVTLLETEARWAIRSGLSVRREVPDYLDYIQADLLRAVRPGAVTVIR